jgi:hypothetical protein
MVILSKSAEKIFEEIEELIRDYIWMKNELERLYSKLYRSPGYEPSWGVAQYGIDAAMPKGSSGKSQAELTEMDAREEHLYKRIKKFENKVQVLDRVMYQLPSDLHQSVYDCLLEKWSLRSIANHFDISRDKAKQIKDEILNQLSQNSQILELLKQKELYV